jgi:hypothetical protein
MRSEEERPWLILGKGPSFVQREGHDLSQYRLLGLNHVCMQQAVELTHAIDIEVVGQCGNSLLERSRFLVMPWVPHCRRTSRIGHTSFVPGPLTLSEYARSHPILRELENQSRLLTYDLATEPDRRFGVGPVITPFWFSATAALELLACSGAKRVLSLGIDGGRTYAGDFLSQVATNLLAGGQSSYDRQFEGFASTITRTGIDFHPLGIESPVDIFIGAEPEQDLATRVLEFSIRRRASLPIRVRPLHEAMKSAGIAMSETAVKSMSGKTPFSYQRFSIPALKSYSGRAVYLDSDMQVFSDIRELWVWPMDGADVVSAAASDAQRAPQFSVMLLDCGRLDWRVEEVKSRVESGDLTYADLMSRLPVARSPKQSLPARWNSLERFLPEHTSLLHYTDMPLQPWVSCLNPLAALWCRELVEAIDAGAIDVAFVKDQIDRGFVRPSLQWQLEARVYEPMLAPDRIIEGDFSGRFVPSFAALVGIEAYRRQHDGLRAQLRRMLARGAALRREYGRRMSHGSGAAWRETRARIRRLTEVGARLDIEI